jgi:hypothetical protein
MRPTPLYFRKPQEIPKGSFARSLRGEEYRRVHWDHTRKSMLQNTLGFEAGLVYTKRGPVVNRREPERVKPKGLHLRGSLARSVYPVLYWPMSKKPLEINGDKELTAKGTSVSLN